MDNLDGSDHYSKPSEEPPISLLTIILDTHPTAWSLLSPTLAFSTFLSHLLVFINAHLACNNSNQICIIAAHPQRAEFLYPSPSSSQPAPSNGSPQDNAGRNGQRDDTNGNDKSKTSEISEKETTEANHYRPFLTLQTTLLASLTHLLSNPSPSTSPAIPSIALSGALSLALTYHNRLLTLSSSSPSTSTTTNPPTTSPNPSSHHLQTRILLISLTGSLSPQYIPLTNTIFACQRLGIPISVAKIAGDGIFLQQACDSTKGTYLEIEQPRGLLQYLMMAFLCEGLSSTHLEAGGAEREGGGGTGTGERGKVLRHIGSQGVDFRAACFCHRRVVEMGWVCSVCLSIFCSPPSDAVCLTCNTTLKLGNYGQKPAVVFRQKKKKRKNNKLDGVNGGGGETGSRAATPIS
ncbi:MAG: hypothetical protein Q9169_003821 [Polycauliona sp. 2 TL-2023]